MYPDDCIQNLVNPWWEKDPNKSFRRGRLLWGYVPHVSITPYVLTPSGRKEPTSHDQAVFEISQFRIHQQTKTLPVAALPEFPGEQYGVYRTKKRPLLLISAGGNDVPKELRRDKPRWQTEPTVLVAPFYGRDIGTTKRSGFADELTKRIRRCEYPQYMWDKLPIPGANESILRFDHIQPLGKHQDSIEMTEHCLTEDAINIVDEWLDWMVYGDLPAPDESVFSYLREELLTL